MTHPRFLVFGDRPALVYSSNGTLLRTGRFVDGKLRLNPPIKVHEYSKSSVVYVAEEGRVALLSGSDPDCAVWLLDAKVEALFRTSSDAREHESAGE